MFKNIGKKIKVIAYVFFIICSIIGIVYGIVLSRGYNWIGILIGILMVLVSWMSGCFIYGFGELIENTSEIKKNIQTLPAEQEKSLSE